ncbi:MAG: gamma-glutamylcyclotransferase (GGCT)/AIG2-like uncharacterized protein YtfP [Pseudohongiellaceae bacterium]|jgi:gamma-glutamylcyclotransferase (GGCT)/AIG2-like uncharacterized protein YtfP
MTDSIDYLFVYGTLRSDSHSDSYRQFIAPDFTLVSRATIAGRLYVIADYPGLLLAEKPTDLVVGEVYSFNGGESQLANIDEYEGCAAHSQLPHLYTRMQKAVSLRDDSQVAAWVYFYNFPVSDTMLIRSGDFLDPF